MPNKNKDHTELICDISELSGLFSHSSSLESFLQKTVDMIADHMNTEVCSVYLYSEATQELVLKATKGLNKDYIENVRLKLGEGLTGLALKQLRPICEHHASENVNFRYFPGLGEEKYESFLSVPIIRGSTKIGAMVVQDSKKNYFTEQDIKALRAITSQLANTIEMAQLILTIEERHERKKEIPAGKDLSCLNGKVGSEGFAHGAIAIHKDDKIFELIEKDQNLKKYTLDDFYQALKVTEEELEDLQNRIEEKLSDVASLIFTAQILMLKDKGFTDAIVEQINNGKNPPLAILSVVKEYVKRFEKLPNAYLREKSHDVKDIGRRLLYRLFGQSQFHHAYEDRIVIARELLPSDALKLSTQKVKGIIVISGGTTSHLSILAQSLQIPLIIAGVSELLYLPAETTILMDAHLGHIYVNPSEEVKNSFKDHEDATQVLEQIKEQVTEETKTADGEAVHLYANVNLLGDLKNARDFKAEGIGLYRTEFPFIVRSNFPSEEEQYAVYKKLVEGMEHRPINFRTLDIGGDKVLSYFEDYVKESNPYLGMRSIRFSLKHLDIFAQQIRAILRAGVNSDLRIMFPMISSVDEFRKAKKEVVKAIKDLKREKVVCHQKPKVGLMIELPAVLEIIDELADEADFFSIGTNDFIQYMLAVDRTNEKVSDQYLPHHPSILRSLKRIVDAANRYKIDVSICGDMAHNEKYLNYFLGIGVRNLSLNPTYLPKIQMAIKNINIKSAVKLTNNILKQSRIKDTHRLIK